MRGTLRKLGHVLWRGWHLFPPTLLGLAVAAAGAGIFFWYARRQSDFILYAAGLLALGVAGLSVVLVALAALRLWLGVRHAPAGLPAGADTGVRVRTGFRFPRLALWPLVHVSMRWEEPATVTVELAGAGLAYAELATFAERGHLVRVVRRFSVADLFGLAQVSFPVAYRHALRVTPARAAGGAELAAGRASGDAFSHPAGKAEGEMIEMRSYQPGDPLRNVLWKTFARTRRLLVRMPERALAPHPTTTAYLVSAEGDEAAASAARLFLEDGLLGREFLFFADGAARATAKKDEALEQIVASRAHREHGGRGLAFLLRSLDVARLGGTLVFAPPVDGPWRAELAAASRRLPSPPTVVIGVDGPLAGRRPTRLGRLLVAPPAAVGVPRGVEALRSLLRAQGMRVTVLHRSTGKLLSERALRGS